MRALPPATGSQARLALAMLLAVYTLNYLDRALLGILAAPIKAELRLSDTAFGAIGGLAFALLYTLLGVPLAALADRTGRARVIAAALATWSACTVLCGFATGYGSLFAARLGVGCGEAGGVAPAHALIAELFAPERRARALGVFALGVPLGMAAGALLGGTLAAWLGWRATFWAMGGVGLALAPLVRWTVRDGSRARRPAPRAPVRASLRTIARQPAFWLLSLAAAASSVCGYGLGLWLPSVLMRSYGLSLVGAARFVGFGVLFAGTLGVLAGGWLADRLGARDRAAVALVPALAWLLAAGGFAAGLSVSDARLAWMILLLPNALNIAWMAPVTTAIQHLVPPPMRATAAGAYLLIVNLIGLGLGPLLMGWLSDALTPRYGADALRHAALACLGCYVLAALLSALAARPLRAGWIEDH